MANQIPVVDYLVLDEVPHLSAHQCTSCDALYFDRRNACAHCGRTDFARKALGTTGTLRAYTQVHRAGPAVKVPYISAVVDLDGGGVVKANLLDATLEDIRPGLPVRLQTFVAGTDDDETDAVAFGFEIEDK
ncbi:Zn-ribbon domain-containing OB-fold protein [Nocardia sp. 348MFTsu5.1]|uniref:Zn-ribbon domain-containing OB-fold protein n=1 Tax=Nocardia sp. 348MFTsu5.1 TaxID=1172185 RepID=UPI000367FB32|nr:OB-fold domain-containing protein [Nocardia sp. 348MFTsu5.1]